MNELQNKQVSMHKDFFDRCELAIENGFFIEAILMEYAAIESRLESISGMLTLPCGQQCQHRKDIKISARIECLRYFYLHNIEIIENTKLPTNFFAPKGELKSWILRRNIIVHGLYKNAIEYDERIKENEQLAIEGYNYSRLLYNEAKRIKRLIKNHSEKFESIYAICRNDNCIEKRNGE